MKYVYVMSRTLSPSECWNKRYPTVAIRGCKGMAHFPDELLGCWNSERKRDTFPLKSLQGVYICVLLTAQDICPQYR